MRPHLSRANHLVVFRSLPALVVIGLLLTSPQLFGEEPRLPGTPAKNLRRTPAVAVVEKNNDAVVNIFSERTVTLENREKHIELMQLQQRVNGMGTGVVIDPRGYILTNHHVVDDVQLLRVRLHDGTALAARVVVREPAEDLAIIKVDPRTPLSTPTFGTATDLAVGETVIAIGNAFGYEHSVTLGVISALKRDVVLNREVSYKSLIQTDASINPGNSGGPLFNIHGELIGINVAIRAGAQGIGFAIPADTALRVAADMLSVKRRTGLAHGMILRDALDVSDNPIRRWATIDRVDPSSPADKAGLRAGDVLDKAGELKIICALELERSFIDRAAGEKLAIVVRRGANVKGEGGEEVRTELVMRTPEKAPAALPIDLVWRKLGVKVQPAPLDLVVKANPQLHGGLLITDVNPNTAAGKSGFQRGDILIGLHQWETINIDNVSYVLNHPDLATFAPVRFYRIRAGQLERGWLANLE
jgi:serine protease Do